MSTGAVNRLGGRVLHWLDGYIRRHSLVGDHAVFESAQFPWISVLEAAWADMRSELEDVLRDREALPNFQDIIRSERHLTSDSGWKTFFLYGYRVAFPKNIERCPRTAALVRRIPGMTTAMFSILAPGKRIPPHSGPYSGVLRYHLALIVPEPAKRCGIRVDDQRRHWQEGRSLVFDDVYEHEVWNDTDGLRVVLFVDFKRPLRGLARCLNELVVLLVRLSPYVRDASARQRVWEEAFETLRSHAR